MKADVDEKDNTTMRIRGAEGENHNEEDLLVYLDRSYDLLPPRPRFIPCLPEGFCYSFCESFIRRPPVKEALRQSEDQNEGYVDNKIDEIKYVILQPSSTEEKSIETDQEVISPLSSSGVLGQESTTSASANRLQQFHYLEEVPTLSSLGEDETEVSEEEEECSAEHQKESSSPVVQSRELRNHAGGLHHPHLPPGAEMLFRFCQFLFSILVVDQVSKKMHQHQKKKGKSSISQKHPATTTSALSRSTGSV